MTVYKSTISASIMSIIAIPILGLLAIAIYYHIWDPIIEAVPIFLFVFYLYRTTYYTINGNILHIQSGFLVNVDVQIDKIRSVKETNTVLSAPAWSLDRIEIWYNTYDSVVISPPDKLRFVADLRAINPSIEFIPKDKK